MSSLKTLFKKYRAELEASGHELYYLSLENLAGERQSYAPRAEDPLPLYSAAKTVSSMAVGFALSEGLISLRASVLGYFPEWAAEAKAGNETILLEHLLTMSSGHRCFFFGVGDRRMSDTDWAELFFSLPLRAEAGQRFYYSNSDVYLAGRVLEKASGEKLLDYLQARLFTPLGIPNPIWGTCPRGHQNASSKLYLMPEEFSRLGHLMLHGGAYQGKQVLPKAYFERACGRRIDSVRLASFSYMSEAEKAQMQAGYGYWIWRGANGSYRADGKYGQFLAVYPAAGLVLTLMGYEKDRPYRCLTLLDSLLEAEFGQSEAD